MAKWPILFMHVSVCSTLRFVLKTGPGSWAFLVHLNEDQAAKDLAASVLPPAQSAPCPCAPSMYCVGKAGQEGEASPTVHPGDTCNKACYGWGHKGKLTQAQPPSYFLLWQRASWAVPRAPRATVVVELLRGTLVPNSALACKGAPINSLDSCTSFPVA